MNIFVQVLLHCQPFMQPPLPNTPSHISPLPSYTHPHNRPPLHYCTKETKRECFLKRHMRMKVEWRSTGRWMFMHPLLSARSVLALCLCSLRTRYRRWVRNFVPVVSVISTCSPMFSFPWSAQRHHMHLYSPAPLAPIQRSKIKNIYAYFEIFVGRLLILLIHGPRASLRTHPNGREQR